MSCFRGIRRLTGPAAVLLLAPALVAMVVSAASVPHLHVGSTPGFYNQEHDLSALATLSGAALLPAVIATATLLQAPGPLLGPAGSRPAPAPRRHADPRAPPLR
jgi:hypothetical protein